MYLTKGIDAHLDYYLGNDCEIMLGEIKLVKRYLFAT